MGFSAVSPSESGSAAEGSPSADAQPVNAGIGCVSSSSPSSSSSVAFTPAVFSLDDVMTTIGRPGRYLGGQNGLMT